MKKLILHIPHSSTVIPSYDGYIPNQQKIEEEIVRLTDWHTDELFVNQLDDPIIAPFSRIFCDVERFPNDEDEVMAQFGMGVLYEKFTDGSLMRNLTEEYRRRMLDEYYWPHHNSFSERVNQHLALYNCCLIVDCHSFPKVPHRRSLDRNPARPDFTIGTDSFHTPRRLISLAEEYFSDVGYTMFIDRPYSGTFVPSAHYKKDKRVHSIMLEVNRGLYMDDAQLQKSAQFHNIKKVIQSFLDNLRAFDGSG